ncbi:hypothetical protein AAHA92_16005 [Salvia divinorum]|uniref:Myb/SANT-like domain-containing protein n=1 Tax=Salvia divinorum TaxID=28513 RepID=A0ABD1GU52_SALDI
MTSRIPSQRVFLYKSNWTPKIDKIMLHTIIRMKKATKWEGTVIPPEFIREASTAINSEVGVIFSWDELYARFQFFEQRYLSFKNLRAVPGVFWNVNTNVVIIPEPIWEVIVKEDALAVAYYYEVPINQFKTETEPAMGFENAVAEGSESVSSPVTGTVPKMRRKLFQEEQNHIDRESTNEPTEYYYAHCPDGKMECKQRTSHPLRALRPPAPPYASPHASSCGSSSPHTWLKNQFK